MTQPPHNYDDDSSPADAHDEAIGRLINEFFDRRANGETVTEDAFIAEHDEYADDLREHLQGLNLIRGIGSSSGDDPFAPNQTQSAQRSFRAEPDVDDEVHIPEIPGYEIQRPLGRGGMGIVYRAIQKSTGRQVALKVLLEGPLAAPQARKRFEREISLSAQLRHPNIIPIYDSGRSDGRLYYAMEYIRGVPLNEYIERESPSVKRRLEQFVCIGEALRHAHQRGVIHRDLKPSNILVRADGEPQLLDFGLAKQGTFSDMTTSLTAQIIGTPAYMSPEQAAGDPTGIDIRTDVYSLGVILFEMLSGEMPYATNVSIGQLLNNIARAEPDESHLVVAGIDPGLIAICLKALEKNKDTRYQSVDLLIADIKHYLADEPISVRPASGIWQLKRTLWKHRLAVAILGLAAALFSGAAITLYRINQAFRDKQEQIVMRDQQLEDRDELSRMQENRLREQQAKLDSYKKTLELFPPNVREFVEAASKTMGGDIGGVGDAINLAAREAGEFAQKSQSTPKAVGKDLEAGTRDISLEGFNPNRTIPTQSADAEPTKLPAWLRNLATLVPEKPAVATTDGDQSATTQPADETVTVDGAKSPTSAPSASDKS